MQLIIITGLSGAGKTQAIRCLEDLGYYCVDNMPPSMMCEFVSLAQKAGSEIEKLGFVADIRQGQFFGDLNSCLDEFTERGLDYKIMFLEASDPELIRRYKATRRAHPLSKDGSVQAGISAERQKLAALRRRASFVIDTTNFKAAALNEEIKRLLLADKKDDNFSITVESFGYKYGLPTEADWVVDARFLPNPFYVASLKRLTGNNKKVQQYVLGSKASEGFVDQLFTMIAGIIPYYIREGKYSLVIAIGCTGGHHRSVAVANALAEKLENSGRRTVCLHRDL